MIRWDDAQPPFDWEDLRRLMLAQLRAPRRPYIIPIRRSLYDALARRSKRRMLFDALVELGAL